MGGSVGEPRAVIGDPRAHPLPGMRQPPVLNVAFDELPRRCSQQVLARNLRSEAASAVPSWSDRGSRRRHSPDRRQSGPIRQASLVESQPFSIIHGPVGRPYLDRAEHIVPVPAALGQDGVKIGRAIARDQAPRVFRARSLPEKEHDLDGAIRWEFDVGAQRATGI
jgi:hypothetical protein